MKDVLKNLANLDLINFCLDNNIDCSGSYCVKRGRGFTYDLISKKTCKRIVSVTFHKSSVPTHTIYFDNIVFKRGSK
jgi:hypothetical protein